MSTSENTHALKVLIVEGKDDNYGIYHLAVQHQIAHLFTIQEGGSDIGALSRFGGLLVAGSIQRPEIIGLVLDCDPVLESDDDPVQRRWMQISSRIEAFGYDLSEGPPKAGAVLNGPESMPKIGIWLMPNNQSSGMLEDFLLQLAPVEAAQFARECVRTSRERGFGHYKLAHEAKAVAHTYLAWQDEPGKPLGLAIKAGQFDSTRQECKAFVEWLRQVFLP